MTSKALNAAEPEPEQYEIVDLNDEMKTSYLAYAMSVIVSRALPDVRDGLKPVQRRIMYAMHDMGVRPGTQHRKSARIVGEVLGKFHPHGDSSVYEALVRMAQPFSMRERLVDGQGNFGSVDGDSAAAMRYTEARLTAAAEDLMAGIEQETVDFQTNFDDSLSEPVVLPAKLPNLLINGGSGIAVGMATSIPPHNTAEVCDAVIHVIRNPECTVSDLMQILPGPDFPTAAVIQGREGIRDMYARGRGRVVMEAVTEIEETRQGRQRIVVTEIPYQVNKASMVEKIAGLVKDKTIQGISEIRDESDRRGVRVVIELARGAQSRVILNNLFRRTQMRTSYNAIMLALVKGQPEELPLKRIIEHFIAHREEVIRRRSEFQLKRAQERDHIVQGLLKALDQVDAIIDTIRNSADVETARNNLGEKFDMSERQAQAILDMQLRRLAALERRKLEQEHEELTATISALEELLASEQQIRDVIVRETEEIREKHPDPRRTRITSSELEDQSDEEFVVDENVVITLTQRGYIKRVPIGTYRNQRRGGKGVRGANNRDDDAIKQLEVVSTRDQLMFFTNQGRAIPLDVFRTPSDAGRTSRGTLLVNLIRLNEDEQVQTMLPMPRGAVPDENERYIFATRKGKVKSLEAEELSRIRPSGIKVTTMAPDDELVSVSKAMPEDSIFLISAHGRCQTFSTAGLRPQKRGASGVQGMRLRDDDVIVAMQISKDPANELLLVVSEKGFAKATPLTTTKGDIVYRETSRRTTGIATFAVDANSKRPTGPVVDAKIVSSNALTDQEGHEIFIISSTGQVTRVNLAEVKVVNTRSSKGVVMWRERSPGDAVVSIACFKDQDQQETSSDDAPEREPKVLREAEEIARQAARRTTRTRQDDAEPSEPAMNAEAYYGGEEEDEEAPDGAGEDESDIVDENDDDVEPEPEQAAEMEADESEQPSAASTAEDDEQEEADMDLSEQADDDLNETEQPEETEPSPTPAAEPEPAPQQEPEIHQNGGQLGLL